MARSVGDTSRRAASQCADRATAIHLRRRYRSLHSGRHHDRAPRGGAGPYSSPASCPDAVGT